MKMSSRYKGYLFALLTAICWSVSGLFVKIVSQSAAVISGIEAVVGLIFIYGMNWKKIRFTKFIVLIGFCQFMMHITFVYANQLCTVGNVIVLQYSSMIFVLIYESIDKKKFPKLYQWFVILIAVVGMIIFFYDSFSFDSILGNVLAIVSGAFFGLQFYLNTKDSAMPESSMVSQFLMMIAFMAVDILLNKNFKITQVEIGELIACGLIQTVLASICFAKCIRLIPAFTANVICMSEIVLAPLWAFILLNEKFTPLSFLGACIIVSSLLLNSYKEMKSISEEKTCLKV